MNSIIGNIFGKFVKSRFILPLWLMMVTLFCSSCIRDELPSCPPLQINIAVKDKNYFNIDKVEQLEERKSENLPLREYVPTLYYRLNCLMADGTERLIEEQGVFPVDGDAETYPLIFDDSLPHGTYILKVWGGLNDTSPLSDNRSGITFHPENSEGADVYMSCDTLVYDATHYFYTSELERTKGKLIVQTIGLPGDVCWSDKNVNGLFSALECDKFTYSGVTGVATAHEWEPADETVTRTVLAPSIRNNGSILRVNFYDEADRRVPALTPEDVSITMKRNSLTVLRYVYDDDNRFRIYILVNDNWERVHDMEID